MSSNITNTELLFSRLLTSNALIHNGVEMLLISLSAATRSVIIERFPL